MPQCFEVILQPFYPRLIWLANLFIDLNLNRYSYRHISVTAGNGQSADRTCISNLYGMHFRQTMLVGGISDASQESP